jgi:hypothetical protein
MSIHSFIRRRGYKALLGVGCVGAVVGAGTLSLADTEVQPSPPSIGADVPVTYFGPPPSSVQPELIGPYQLLKSGVVDTNVGTVTLPLYRGQLKDGRAIWYILTDTDDPGNAEALGLNFSAKLTYANACDTARHATLEGDGTLTFDRGTVDFSPDRALTPGDSGQPFPPKAQQAGSVGDADYTPIVKLESGGGHIYNAPMIAFDVPAETLNAYCAGGPDKKKVHDKVVKICPRDGTVTLNLTTGFSFSRPVLYLSTETNDPVASALEEATLAPGLLNIRVGGDDTFTSPVERLFAFTNGPQNVAPKEINPQRQGLFSAIVDGNGPLNVLGGIPTIATDYSPLWDFNLGEWTPEAVTNGYRSRMTDEFQILGMVARGFVTGPGGKPYGSTGIVVNCPIVQRLL